MPWLHMLDKDRKITATVHLNMGRKGRDVKYCRFCLMEKLYQFGTKLCDYELGGGRTCDASMCDYHAQHIGDDLDLCPNHGEQELFPK